MSDVFENRLHELVERYGGATKLATRLVMAEAICRDVETLIEIGQITPEPQLVDGFAAWHAVGGGEEEPLPG